MRPKKIKKSKILTAKQLQYMEMLADPTYYDKSQEEIAALLGVKTHTLNYWKKSIPDFWERVYEIAQRKVKKHLPKILETMAKKAAQGDVQAARLILEHLGKLTKKVEFTLKLPQVFVELYEQGGRVVIHDREE